jgi:hypothetical protein
LKSSFDVRAVFIEDLQGFRCHADAPVHRHANQQDDEYKRIRIIKAVCEPVVSRWQVTRLAPQTQPRLIGISKDRMAGVRRRSGGALACPLMPDGKSLNLRILMRSGDLPRYASAHMLRFEYGRPLRVFRKHERFPLRFKENSEDSSNFGQDD